MFGTWDKFMKTEDENAVETFWGPAVYVQNLHLSSAGSVLCSCCKLWLSSSVWINSKRLYVWLIIRYSWFNLEMEYPADANWADASAVFTYLLKNHIIIGLGGERFTAQDQKWLESGTPSEHCQGLFEQDNEPSNAQAACLGQPTHLVTSPSTDVHVNSLVC